MIPQSGPRIDTFIAASYRPEERPKREKKEKKEKKERDRTPSTHLLSLMGEPTSHFPSRSRSTRTTHSSQSSQSTSSREQEHLAVASSKQKHKHDPRRDRTPTIPSPAAVARSARPSVASSTSSAAPSLPASSRESAQLDDHDHDRDREHDPDDHHPHRPEYRPRDSVASIKDDPFFRHYQTPQSVSLGRELMAATYEDADEDAELVSPLSPRPRSTQKPPVDEGVNIPVSRPRSANSPGAQDRERENADVEVPI